MVKYVVTLLISFKKFSGNDVEITTEADVKEGATEKEQEERSPLYFFKPLSDQKNVCNMTYFIPGPTTLIETKISITCWSKLFKIYSKKEDMAFKTVSYAGKTWAAFTIHHKSEDFDSNRLKNIYPLTLEFRFNDDWKSVLQRARTERIGMYCCTTDKNDDIEFHSMQQVQETPKNIRSQRMKSKFNPASRKSGVSTLSRKSKTHFFSKDKTCEPQLNGRVANIHLCRLVKAMETRVYDNIKYGLPSSSTGCSLLLPASYLFYDNPVWALKNEKSLSSNIEDIYVFLSACSFLNDATRMCLNPYSINIRALQNLPRTELQNKGIRKICVEYELDPIIPTTRTKFRDFNHSGTVQFREIKVFLNEELSKISIVSNFQSRKLLVRILGKKDTSSVNRRTSKPVNSPSNGIYGSNWIDDHFSSCIKVDLKNRVQHRSNANIQLPLLGTHEMRNKTKDRKKSPSKPGSKGSKRGDIHHKEPYILLGTARIDLSPLIFGNNCIFIYEAISSLPVIKTESKKDENYIDRFNITVAHADKCRFETGFLRNMSFCESNTVVKLTAKCGFLLTPQFIKSELPLHEAFSRTIAIFNDKQSATHVLQTILTNNRTTLDMKYYNPPLVPLRKMYEVEPSPALRSFQMNQQQNFSNETYEVNLEDLNSSAIPEDNLESWFTGFCIDCVNIIMMFVEGPTVKLFPTLLTELVKVHSSQGRIMYSSDLMYNSNKTYIKGLLCRMYIHPQIHRYDLIVCINTFNSTYPWVQAPYLRVYDAFKDIGGMYCITMKHTIHNLLKKGSLSHEAAIPEPAWKVLIMISKLFNCKNVLEAVQDNYLPQPEQLISFDVEFGLPHCVEK